MRIVSCLALSVGVAVHAHAETAPAGPPEPTPGGDELRVLPEQIDGVRPADMMSAYLRGQVRERVAAWERAYEQRTTVEAITAHQARLRGSFLEALGELPRRTPLDARVTGVVERSGYTVEKVVFESQPDHPVTALLYLPDPAAHAPPHAGVLVPCGHTYEAKGYDAYQRAAALLALNGLAALCFDPIDQGERIQLLDETGKPRTWGTGGHTMVGVGAILLGRNTATYELWDSMRAIDYLQTRPEVDPDRIGCMGNSGGGTQTSYLMALDDRIAAASPSCYITSFGRLVETIGVQDAEQNVFGQLAFGMDHADYLTMRAPTPILICAATRDFFDIEGTWRSYRYAKRLYTRLGHAGRIDLLEDDKPHNYDRVAREAAVSWMIRWLDGRDQPVAEGPIETLSAEEFRCTPEGQVALLEGTRTVYDLNRQHEGKLRERRVAAWSSEPAATRLERVRELAGVRTLPELPRPEVERRGTLTRGGCSIDKLVLRPEPGIRLPALLLRRGDGHDGGAVLYVDEAGKGAAAEPGGACETLVGSGRTVLAVDLRGTGETRQSGQGYFRPHFGADGQDVYTAYLLGRSYVGMRAEDVLVCARWLSERVGAPVHLVARGDVGVPAWHAAALEPRLFETVDVGGAIASWAQLVEAGWTTNQLVNAVHGALREYDLPDLVAAVQDKVPHEPAPDASTVRFERTATSVRVLLGGRLFTELHFAGAAKPYLHPVIEPGGEPVTRDYPMASRPGETKDHPHHTSMWFAHGSVNGHDFWHGPRGETIACVEPPATRVEDGVGVLTARFEWRDGAGGTVCVEDRTMRISGGERVRVIDFDLTLTALDQPVTFGDTKEGTFAVRVAPTLRVTGPVAAGTLRNGAGDRDAACWGKRAAWIDVEGPLGGHRAGVAIVDHTENPRHPTWWHARTYGLVAANPFGVHDFEGKPAGTGDLTIASGESIRFRYRIIVHAGGWEPMGGDAGAP